eukprot:scaffold6967_cov38-Tisochrysis_lutea.AAC.1
MCELLRERWAQSGGQFLVVLYASSGCKKVVVASLPPVTWPECRGIHQREKGGIHPPRVSSAIAAAQLEAHHLPDRHIEEERLGGVTRAPARAREQLTHLHLSESLVEGRGAHGIESRAVAHPAEVELSALVHVEEWRVELRRHGGRAARARRRHRPQTEAPRLPPLSDPLSPQPCRQ